MSISEKTQNNNDKNNSIVNIQTSLVIKEKGCEIKLNNDFFNDLSKIMENSEFNSFFKKYMTDWQDVKAVIVYMKLYSEFKKKYETLNNEKLDSDIVVFLLQKIMQDKEARPFAIETVNKIYENKRVTFFKEFEKFLKNKNKNLISWDKE
tara:strand:+ start:780 stop:1229 length:450 start_codon:yes stop_codon:yes gene_type:complete